MIIALRTNRPSLIKIMDIPIIGSFIMFIFALIPMFILMITDGAFGFSYQDLQTNIIYFIVGVYNFILAFFFGISIWIMILPSLLLFTLIGILKLIGWI